MLSTLEELKAIPCGTQLASFCGQVVAIMPSEKKITALLSSFNGDNVAVTEFKNVSTSFSKICSLGTIVKCSLLKAQRFVKERYDGKTIYNTPLDYEFVIMTFSKIEVVQCVTKTVDSFDKLTPGCLFSMHCALATPFAAVGKKVAAVVADTNGARADLYIYGENVERIGAFKKNMSISLQKFFVKIEDECLLLHCDVSYVKSGTGHVNLDGILMTPIKRRSFEDDYNKAKKGQKIG